ncbi:S-layer protein [Alloalcanivorax marinus]|uniref:S-layer protein n=1 Tax=Alloalcanivorax marinus TaxID=1177169 RepID=UPI001932139A|nr:S-layer protein [Alloalcanivorax marinus]MBL7250160.1 S-layer protein [Alloalcanivorax marinus]
MNVRADSPFSRRARWSLLACAVALSACGGDSDNDPVGDADPEPTPPVARAGGWTHGDLHVHTYQSDDAQVSLQSVLDDGFDHYGLDWMALSNHLRLSGRDHTGSALQGGAIPFSRGLVEYEKPYVEQAQAEGRYEGKTIFSTVEWDMPTHDHVNIGIGMEAPYAEDNLRAVAEFEYLFTNRDPALFDAGLVDSLSDQTRAYSTHEDSLKAIEWLRDHHPDSYMLLNHPNRYMNKYTVAQLREMNDLAPEIFFSIEGMVGNQMEPDRGGYVEAYTDANLASRTYGGTDYIVATLGGPWDALLGEGRRIWTVANSDYHFTTAQGRYSSGYAPGEYAKTYVWLDDDARTPADLLEALRGGRLFGVFGDLIDALSFQAQAGDDAAMMGDALAVDRGEQVTVTIRFRSPERNNYEYPLESGHLVQARPVVDHVDLIVGDVSAPATPGSAAYQSAENPSTRVLARFNANDWSVDEDGFATITHTLTVTGDQYLRLRGTNLAPDVDGETQDGEPLPDRKVDLASDAARFDAINARNYNDLWFYSNPIFLTLGD